ncbi:hypothetical protein BGZ82_011337 [Podila clonocystis]|nr:hypothetical protein BGZ82_011337 [Podila clonocystis]
MAMLDWRNELQREIASRNTSHRPKTSASPAGALQRQHLLCPSIERRSWQLFPCRGHHIAVIYNERMVINMPLELVVAHRWKTGRITGRRTRQRSAPRDLLKTTTDTDRLQPLILLLSAVKPTTPLVAWTDKVQLRVRQEMNILDVQDA